MPCKHIWVVDEKNTDQDVCAKCGTTLKVWNRNPHPNRWESTFSLDALKEKAIKSDGEFDIGDKGREAEKTINKTELNLAKKKLSQRQAKIMEMRADNKSYQEIADELGISKKTVDDHIQKVRIKARGK